MTCGRGNCAPHCVMKISMDESATLISELAFAAGAARGGEMPKVIAKKKTPTLKVAGEEQTAKLKRSNATTKKKSRQSLSAVQVAPGS